MFWRTQDSCTDSERLEETSEKPFPKTQLVSEKLWRSGQHHWPNIRAASMRWLGVSGHYPGAESSTSRLVVGTDLLSQLGFCVVLPQEDGRMTDLL